MEAELAETVVLLAEEVGVGVGVGVAVVAEGVLLEALVSALVVSVDSGLVNCDVSVGVSAVADVLACGSADEEAVVGEVPWLVSGRRVVVLGSLEVTSLSCSGDV